MTAEPDAGGEQRLVSVIIPCYNQGRFLGQALQSLRGQSYPHRETLVVDDGSSDGTAQVAARFPEVRCVRQTNQGTAAARNRGARESRGAYLLFLDADDRLLPGALEVGVAALEEHAGCGFVYGHVRRIREDGRPLDTPPPEGLDGDPYLALLRHNSIWTPGVVLYRRAAFEWAGGFDRRADASADFDLNIRIASRWPLYCHGLVVLEYREYDASQSASAARMLRSSVSVRRRHRRQVRRQPEQRVAVETGIREVQRYYGRLLGAEVKALLRARRWRQALFALCTLARYYPADLAGLLWR